MRGTARVRAYPPCVVILVSLVKLINLPCQQDTGRDLVRHCHRACDR